MTRDFRTLRGASSARAPVLGEGRRRRAASFMVAMSLFALVTVVRFEIDGLSTPVAMLYVFAIAAAALEFEIVGGLLMGLLSSATFLAWVVIRDHEFTAGIWMRVIILVGIGLVIGWVSRERHREGAIARAVLDSMPDPASVKDLEGRYLLVNAALERVLQRQRDDIVGMDRPIGQPPEVVQLVAEADRRVVETGEAIELELPGQVPDVGEVTMRTIKAPVKDAAGQVIAIVTYAHDISARVEHERAIIAMGEQARDEYERALADYRRLMRHRIANPLTIIQGAAETLRLAHADDAANRRAIAALISTQVDRLADMELDVGHVGPEERDLEARASADLEAIRQRVSGQAETIRPLPPRRDGAG